MAARKQKKTPLTRISQQLKRVEKFASMMMMMMTTQACLRTEGGKINKQENLCNDENQRRLFFCSLVASQNFWGLGLGKWAFGRNWKMMTSHFVLIFAHL